MNASYSSQQHRRMEAVLAALPKKSGITREFITNFFALAPREDWREMDPRRAASIVEAAYTFFKKRPRKNVPALHIQQDRVVKSGRSTSRLAVIAVNDDRPFLLDSLTALFTSLGLSIHHVYHPIYETTRDAKGVLTHIDTAGVETKSAKKRRESLIYFELSSLPAALTPPMLEAQVLRTLRQVEQSVNDWQAMHHSVSMLAAQYTKKVAGVAPQEAQEIADLLRWLADNHFVFLGLARFSAKQTKHAASFEMDPASALGIYRLPALDSEAIEFSHRPTTSQPLTVLKASSISEVHRRVNMDYLAIRQVNARGETTGEFRILGLFTSTVYWRETEAIPFLRRKTARILQRAAFDPQSHAGKSLKTTLEFLPRDELFQMDEDALFHMAMGIVSLETRPQVRLFLRQDPFERFISAMVYVPRERFSNDLCEKIVTLLTKVYRGTFVTVYTQLTDSPLARATLVVGTPPGIASSVDEVALETSIAALANDWAEALHDTILLEQGGDDAEALAQSFADAFPVAYMNAHTAQEAAFDVRKMQQCLSADGLALELYRKAGDPKDQLHLKCFTRDVEAQLSAIIPLLENMGAVVMDATPYLMTPRAPTPPLLLRDFALRFTTAAALDLAKEKARIEEAIAATWRGQYDNDTLNALVIAAGLDARDVSILRALSRYLQQLGFPYSQPFIAAALVAHAALAALLVQLFHARFSPATKKREAACAQLQQQLEQGLESVTNLAEDRIIRRFLALIQAGLRTNYYQRGSDGAPKSYLSIKFRSAAIPEMPLPVPYAEIFVTSMRVEGIHLRGGSVARGGLRWSDRPEDFRSEVLGLVKAQMVKNAVIVPQGAKGGFIVRRPLADRAAQAEEGVACYRIFLQGLLDLTDNLVEGRVVAPAHTVRHDGDDPYLVVAADKGTASFSDIANGVAASYGFWLGDAFASGGSAGYDHKEMAITARGGWVSVERHFREMGRDIITEEFTATGIGDMSGDVFGNGMLLSRKMRLIAAFNHRHIFIDPQPQAERSFKERERLFHLPRSGWNDYDAGLISKGGGVFERSAKSIKLTSEMRAVLSTDATAATPDELIRIILKAPVDLLWNGGIGTYVKASDETHEEVGDRGNAGVRINGAELRCKIVGEGGNLGFTQLGRIEYARGGGRINTDAIDNSGGVDCSDHEVNIKIALGAAVASGALSLAKRNALLKEMTEEVSALVLTDNRLQTQAISIAQGREATLLDPAEQLIQQLESEKFLNRDVEYLPDAKQFAMLRAARRGLTRPEIAVLLAYAKMALSRDLKESAALDSPYFESDLLRYFPKRMQKAHVKEINAHPLKRDIVATMITNSIVNRTGFAFAQSLMRATGLQAAPVALAYVATRDAFSLRPLWKEIEALDHAIPAELQAKLFSRINRFIEHFCRWFLAHVPQPMDVGATVKRYADGIASLSREVERLMTETLKKSYQADIEQWVGQQIPERLAKQIAGLEVLSSACDIIDIAAARNLPVTVVGANYFELGAQLRLGWLRMGARDMTTEGYWQQQAVQALVIELYQAQRRLTLDVLQRYSKQPQTAAAQWSTAQTETLARYQTFIEQLHTQAGLDYAMLIVALRQVQDILGANSA